jgi:hypothetical protein
MRSERLLSSQKTPPGVPSGHSVLPREIQREPVKH